MKFAHPLKANDPVLIKPKTITPLLFAPLNKIIALVLCLPFLLVAQPPIQPTNNARYTHWVNELRCPVCQGQSIAESNAKMAIAIRQTLLELIASQKTNAQIQHYFVEKYGDDILMTPPVQSNTYLLWAMPYLLLIGFFGVLWRKKYHP